MNNLDLNFTLTESEQELSKKLTGNVCRVIIPNGFYKEIPNNTDENVYYFPEIYLSMKEVFSFVDNLKNDSIIITNAVGIISAVPNVCIRVIENGELKETNVKTFAANIGELYLDLFQLNGMLVPANAAKYVNSLIADIENASFEDIEIIGECIITQGLKDLKKRKTNKNGKFPFLL